MEYLSEANILFANDSRQIERKIIDFIINLKEHGKQYSAIHNYFSAITAFYKINDIVLNVTKISKFMPDNPICLTGKILEKEYPELIGKFDFYSQIVTDLFDRGLITGSLKIVVLKWDDDGNKEIGDFITPMGRRFIRYISIPIGL